MCARMQRCRVCVQKNTLPHSACAGFAPKLTVTLTVARTKTLHLDSPPCTHTSVSHAHFFDTVSLRDVQTSRTRMAQGVCSVYVISLHLAFSILMFHPPSLLFPHGHFDTTFPSALSSSSFTRPESADQARFRTSAEESGYLAGPTHSTRPALMDDLTAQLEASQMLAIAVWL